MSKWILSTLVGAAALLATPGFSHAQRGGHSGGPSGGHAGGAVHGGAVHGGAVHGGAYHGGAVHGGAVHGGAYHGGAYHGGAYYGSGYNRGYGSGLFLYANLSPSYYGNYGGYGYGYRPYYDSNYYTPSYSTYSNYYTPSYSSYVTPSRDLSAYYNPPAVPALTPMASAVPATLEVHVPADAELFLDGNPTRQRGEVRTFESPPLQTGQVFTYEIRARWMQDGKPVEMTRSVDVSAGTRPVVDFRQP